MGGSLEYEEITSTLEGETKYQNIKYFVETGTYQATTTLMASDHYQKVYTMEIVPELYEGSKKRAEEQKKTNIEFLLGDSVQHLRNVTPLVKDGAVFFIDAHQSGPDTSNNGKRVPLMEELGVILDNNVGPSLFIFDDLRFWVQQEQHAWDWADVSEQGIFMEFFKRGYNVERSFAKNDRFFVLAEYKE